MNKFFGRHVVVIVFYDDRGNVLLQDRHKISKRGEEWGFYGGGMHDGETKENALRRELKEELNYEINNFKYLGDCVNKLEDGYIVDRKVFLAPIPENLKHLHDHEGEGYKIFPIAEAKKLKLIPGDEKIFDMIL